MKTVVITGSTDGIGKLAAKKIAQENYQVILHGRNEEKLKSVQKEIAESTGNKNIRTFSADLSDLNEVRLLGKRISDEVAQIDVLINNAGVFKSTNSNTKAGLELRFAVNYLAPVVLTSILTPFLGKDNARIINVSSAAQAPVSLEALKGKEPIDVQNAYAQSKLALTMWSFFLASQLNQSIVIAVNPGSLLNTKMANEAYGQHWSPATKGSDILYDLAVSDAYKNSTGLYFDNDQGNPKGAFGNAHDDAYHQEKINELIAATNQTLENEK